MNRGIIRAHKVQRTSLALHIFNLNEQREQRGGAQICQQGWRRVPRGTPQGPRQGWRHVLSPHSISKSRRDPPAGLHFNRTSADILAVHGQTRGRESLTVATGEARAVEVRESAGQQTPFLGIPSIEFVTVRHRARDWQKTWSRCTCSASSSVSGSLPPLRIFPRCTEVSSRSLFSSA